MTGSEFNDHDQALVDIQCEIQLCETKEEFDRFRESYSVAKELAHEWIREDKDGISFLPYDILSYVRVWAETIDSRNRKGFRKIPIYIGGEVRRNQDEIPRQVKIWSESFSDWYNNTDSKGFGTPETDPGLLYEWFERIHPFIDGNGRTGHLLWAFAMTRLNGVWPRTLPPNVFDDPRLRNHIYVHGEHLVKWDIRSDVWDFDTGRWL